MAAHQAPPSLGFSRQEPRGHQGYAILQILGGFMGNWSVLKEINPEYSLEGLMLKLKLQYFGHLM